MVFRIRSIGNISPFRNKRLPNTGFQLTWRQVLPKTRVNGTSLQVGFAISGRVIRGANDYQACVPKILKLHSNIGAIDWGSVLNVTEIKS
jgi:hypothetical protein